MCESNINSLKLILDNAMEYGLFAFIIVFPDLKKALV